LATYCKTKEQKQRQQSSQGRDEPALATDYNANIFVCDHEDFPAKKAHKCTMSGRPITQTTDALAIGCRSSVSASRQRPGKLCKVLTPKICTLETLTFALTLGASNSSGEISGSEEVCLHSHVNTTILFPACSYQTLTTGHAISTLQDDLEAFTICTRIAHMPNVY